MRGLSLFTVVLWLIVTPCSNGLGSWRGQTSAPPVVHVLFIGNSLTAANELSAMVKAMAGAADVQVEFDACTPGGVSLEDHWNDNHCRKLLAKQKWDFVVLQQGPSSRPQSAANLKEWAERWSNAIRQAGARPALYMVWPYQDQKNGFEQVSRSYRAAAQAAGAIILPSGDAWREAIGSDSTIKLYDADHLHPTPCGTYLAALVICERLTGIRPDAVPARLRLSSGQTLELPADQVKLLQEAATKVCEREKDSQRDSNNRRR
jgi:hypothetical protein